MAWYVFALVDRPPARRAGSGLTGALSVRSVPGGFAVVERRADVPPAEFDTLQAHEAVVSRLATTVPAILPVRFGTLLELDEIEEALAEREQEIADAFAAVRGRVQFTWRTTRAARGARAARLAPASPGTATPGSRGALTGSQYLRRAANTAKAVPPAAFRTVRESLRPLVVAERDQPATTSLPESLYHLVERGAVERYRVLADGLASASSVLRVTGPFPPFAFAADLL